MRFSKAKSMNWRQKISAPKCYWAKTLQSLLNRHNIPIAQFLSVIIVDSKGETFRRLSHGKIIWLIHEAAMANKNLFISDSKGITARRLSY